MSGFGSFVLFVIVAAAAIAIVVWLLSWLYRRSTKEVSFVRTGFGGQTVVANGGALVLPILHETIPVGMGTTRLEVRRARESALITRDRMRVDVTAEFYVHVAPNDEAIATAAQTLGHRTMQPESLRELIEGKFVDALRTAAAEMTMEEMHEKRGEYVKRVRASVKEDLVLNGLELETVSLTALDQTSMEFFNPSNAFDAEGMTRLTEQIERRKKIRNDIELDTLVQIRNKNLEAEKLTLEIDRESEYAKLSQERELEIRRAEQRSDLARERAEQERTAEQAQILAREQVERARIAMERALDEERIARERAIQELEISRRRTLELAEQQRAVAVAEASKAQSVAQAEADKARAEAVAAEERVFSAREVEQAERRKQIELIAARQEAEREAIRLRLLAEAEKVAASDRADALRLAAEGEADSEKIKSAAWRLRHEVEAEGVRGMNEAQNVLTDAARASAARMRLIDKLESIVRESARPMEKIESIRILHVDGLGGGSTPAAPDGAGGGANLPESIVNSALRYRAQAPLVDSLLRELGIPGAASGQVDPPVPPKA
ncbi:MAG: flotillin family protein [Tagaea sp.]